jgi:hypothetical protein
MTNPEQVTIVGAKLTFNSLTDQELAAVNIAAQGFGVKPTTMGYEKVAHLVEPNGKLHELVLTALVQVVNNRL